MMDVEVMKVFNLSEEHEKRAMAVHRKAIVADTHCDTIGAWIRTPPRPLGVRSDEGAIDIPRMKEGGLTAKSSQCTPPRPTMMPHLRERCR